MVVSASGVVGQPLRAGGPGSRESAWARSAKHFRTRRPEVRLINDYAVIQDTLRKVATGLAYLSLTWSTVVLLGGFVSVLKLIDFWFLTAISTSFAVNLADVYEYKIAVLLDVGKVYIGLRDKLARGLSSCGHVGLCLVVVCSMLAETCLAAVIIAVFLFLQIPGNAPLVAIGLCLYRLVVDSYGNADGDAASARKLKASLDIFYSLALAQNIVLSIWSLFLGSEVLRASAVSRQYGLGKWGTILVKRYLRETRTVCATEGLVPWGRNLITFAVKLLGSESLNDRRSAVRLLDTFVGKQIPAGPDLLPCKDRLENLLEALEVGDGETRERAAKIVVALAGDLRRIDQFPTALHNIASLLQASSEERQGHASDADELATACGSGMSAANTVTTTSMRWWRYGPLYCGMLFLSSFFISDDKRDKQDDGEPKLLISQGLLIIERLALVPC
ncbi:unnamed protein product [Urochloa humidicola]